MTQSAIRLSDANYDAVKLLERVRDLFARDRHFLGPIVQRSALLRLPSGELQHVITKIDVLPKESPAPQRELSDYGTLLFVCESYDETMLLGRLKLLVDKAFAVEEHTLTSSGLGFSDRYEASNN